MIKCIDCKHYDGMGWCNFVEELVTDGSIRSCIHAERADGLKECCETCKNLVKDQYECEKEMWGIYESFSGRPEGHFNFSEMKCGLWEAK